MTEPRTIIETEPLAWWQPSPTTYTAKTEANAWRISVGPRSAFHASHGLRQVAILDVSTSILATPKLLRFIVREVEAPDAGRAIHDLMRVAALYEADPELMKKRCQKEAEDLGRSLDAWREERLRGKS